MKWLIKRVKEPSTWASISAGASALAFSLESGQGLVVALVAAVIGATLPEKGSK